MGMTYTYRPLISKSTGMVEPGCWTVERNGVPEYHEFGRCEAGLVESVKRWAALCGAEFGGRSDKEAAE